MAKHSGGYCPYAHAEHLGIKLVYRRLEKSNGLWVPEHRAIFLQPGMRAAHERSVLAHEIGHAKLGHEHRDNPKHELQAHLYAARRLINRADYIKAERMYGGNRDLIAHQLGVVAEIVRAYQLIVEREIADARNLKSA